jgi:hypothetical protein
MMVTLDGENLFGEHEPKIEAAGAEDSDREDTLGWMVCSVTWVSAAER